jgi:hypothetical protein
MDSFLENIGFMAICFVIIYGYKKLLEYNEMKYSSLYEDNKVYQAADEFVHGAASNEVVNILTSCIDFDEKDADKILSLSIPHKTDRDGGYRKFIKSVNKVLGADIYSEQCHAH